MFVMRHYQHLYKWNAEYEKRFNPIDRKREAFKLRESLRTGAPNPIS
jgi:hypothetical protein